MGFSGNNDGRRNVDERRPVPNETLSPDKLDAVVPIDWQRWSKWLDLAQSMSLDMGLSSEKDKLPRDLERLIGSLPKGTVIAVKLADDVVAETADTPMDSIARNIANGNYITAPNGLAAMDVFEERFGKSAVAWVHEIGVPISLGGGLWALSSGA